MPGLLSLNGRKIVRLYAFFICILKNEVWENVQFNSASIQDRWISELFKQPNDKSISGISLQ